MGMLFGFSQGRQFSRYALRASLRACGSKVRAFGPAFTASFDSAQD